ncbi:alkaline shock response membrane anchor protein AmaP [Streptococcus iniae]
MAKSLKIIYSLLGLILLSIFAVVIGITRNYVDLPASYDWLQWDIDRTPELLNPGLYYYFFWTALVLAVVTLIFVLVVIFYPRTYTEIQLSKKQGTLLLKKSAIEGYIKTAVHNAGLMTNPNVSATLYKRKFKVDVVGRLDSRVAVSEQINGIQEGIQKGLQEFFSLDQPIAFKVYVKDIADTHQITHKKNRVE